MGEMEYIVIYAALLIVIILLFLVVYENSTLPRRIGSRLGRMARRRNHTVDQEDQQEDQVVAMITTGENAIDDEAKEPDPLEAAMDRIARLEEGMAKVSEDTQGISEDMKDVVGALRISIDKLINRLDQVDGAITEIRLTIGPLPQSVEDAADGIKEVSNRLQAISSDLHRTLGYAIQKIFKCQSCGSEGLVASQVLCSKCGNESWWGWWPANEGSVENKVGSELTTLDSGQ